MKKPPPVEYLQHLFKEEQFNDLVVASDMILSEDPEHVRALYWRACALLRLDRIDDALENLDQAIDLYDEYADAFSQRGVIFFHKGELQMALDDMNSAVLLEPKNPYRYSSRAYIKSSMNQLESAIEDYEHAIRLDPEDAVAHNNLGLLQEKLGYRNRAQKNFEQADRLMVNEEGELIKDERDPVAPVENKSNVESKGRPSMISTIKNVFTSKAGFSGYLRFVRTLLLGDRN